MPAKRNRVWPIVRFILYVIFSLAYGFMLYLQVTTD